MNGILNEWISKLSEQREAFERLEDYAVLYRYPGASAEFENAEEALSAAASIRTVMRALLELDDKS